LWRLQHGELPDSLNPAVFWVLIGTNDLGTMECSAENVVVGNIRVVEEILMRKPSATVVINGILPRSNPYNMEGSAYALSSNSTSNGLKPVLQIYIDIVNAALEKYAENRDRVEYFSTDVFWADSDPKSLQLNETLMPDFLHPNALGYDAWAQEIVKKLDTIMI